MAKFPTYEEMAKEVAERALDEFLFNGKSLRKWMQIIVSKDTVSRKELLKIFEDRFWELQKLKQLKDNKGAEDRQMGVNYCINILKELPPVIPQPRIGHWISHKEHCENLGVMPSGLGCYKWCSNCDCGIDVKEWHRNQYNFCPNCGVRMEVEKE